ncbi:MAG: HTH domain-containing protein [Dysgonomonas sp.]
MKIFEALNRLTLLHDLIKAEKTGRPDYLSKQLGVSRATLYNMLDELKSYDAPISYSRSKESFFYTHFFELEIKCTISVIENEQELKKVIGGCDILSSVLFFRRKGVNFINNKLNRLTFEK